MAFLLLGQVLGQWDRVEGIKRVMFLKVREAAITSIIYGYQLNKKNNIK